MHKQTLATLRKWLYIDDEEGVDIIYATAIAALTPGDPVWLMVIAPPGGCKTEIIRSFTGKHVHSFSQFTPRTLISGLVTKKGNVDLLPTLDGKLVTIKDFTSILAKTGEVRDELFADLREAYDGYLEKSFGSGVGTKGFHATFGLICGVTPVIDKLRVVHSTLGERFLKLRYSMDAEAAIKQAQAMSGKEKEMRKELNQFAQVVMDYYNLPANHCNGYWDDDVAKTLRLLGYLIALLRSDVTRDSGHYVSYQPLPEVGTRLVKQLTRLYQALNAWGSPNPLSAVRRICRDCLTPERWRIVNFLRNGQKTTNTEVSTSTRLAASTVSEATEDLWLLGILERDRPDKAYCYWLKPKIKQQLEEAGL